MLEKISWNFFEATGDIKAYLAFKELQYISGEQEKIEAKLNRM